MKSLCSKHNIVIMSGYPYVVSRYLSDGTIELSRVKIGYFTGNDLENQVHQNYSRSLTPIVIYDYIPSHNPRWAETTIHIALNKWRINPQNEIFDLSSQEARDEFVNIKEIIIQITEKSGFSTPMVRNIDYNYWRIAKQAAKVGRNWHKIYIEKQLFEEKKRKKKDADQIKQEKERKIKKKQDKKKIKTDKIEKNNKKINDSDIQQFIDNCCSINNKYNANAGDIRTKFNNYTNSNISFDDFKEMMRKKGFNFGMPTVNGKRVKSFIGLQLLKN